MQHVWPKRSRSSELNVQAPDGWFDKLMAQSDQSSRCCEPLKKQNPLPGFWHWASLKELRTEPVGPVCEWLLRIDSGRGQYVASGWDARRASHCEGNRTPGRIVPDRFLCSQWSHDIRWLVHPLRWHENFSQCSALRDEWEREIRWTAL